MQKYLYFIALLLVSLSSCSIREDIHFNNDLSGSMQYKIDMEQFVLFYESMSAMDSTASEEEPVDFKQMIDSLARSENFSIIETMDGISNFQSKSQDYTFTISFDFNTVESLNKAYQQMRASDESMMGEETTELSPTAEMKKNYTYFEKTKKGIIYSLPRTPSEAEGTEESDMQSMDEMIQFETHLTFDKTIKKVTQENITATQQGNEIIINPKISELMTKDPNPVITIQLK